MTDDITSAIISILAGGAATGATLFGGNGPVTTGIGTSQQEFPEATRRLIGSTEFPLLAGFLGDEASRTSLLGGNVNTNPFVQQQYGNAATDLAGAAGREGAGQAGIADFGPINEGFAGLGPELTNALRQLTLAQGAKSTGVVQQGYGNFLAPASTSTSAKVNNPNPFATGSTLASGLTGIAAGVQGLSASNSAV